MALKGKQKNIDANKDGRISAEDFQILRSRQRGGMKKKMGGGLMAATQKLKSQGKMGGGMMKKVPGYKKGSLNQGTFSIKPKPGGAKPSLDDYDQMKKMRKKMGGGMMMKPIMANKGTKIDLDKRNKSFFSGFSKVFKGPQDSGRVATIGGVKPKLTRSDRRKRRTFKSLQEMRTAKGFRPGETPKQFNQRKELAKLAKEGIKKTRLGKIVLPIALAGAGAVQYLKSKMNKNKPDKKMGGGMMMKPMMARKGEMISKTLIGRPNKKEMTAKEMEKIRRNFNAAKLTKTEGSFMGGGMMNMPGYKKGKSVMAKGCKLGRKKPTKMYT